MKRPKLSDLVIDRKGTGAFTSGLEPLGEGNAVCCIEHEDMITVLVPEFVTSKWWAGLLHNQTAIFLKAALLFKRGVVVTSVRYHL